MSSTPEEDLLTLPVNHPEAGYVAPAKDTVVGTGTLPDVEQQAWDERLAAQEAEERAVAEHEHDVAVDGIDDPDAPPPEGGEGEGEGGARKSTGTHETKPATHQSHGSSKSSGK